MQHIEVHKQAQCPMCSLPQNVAELSATNLAFWICFVQLASLLLLVNYCAGLIAKTITQKPSWHSDHILLHECTYWTCFSLNLCLDHVWDFKLIFWVLKVNSFKSGRTQWHIGKIESLLKWTQPLNMKREDCSKWMMQRNWDKNRNNESLDTTSSIPITSTG